MRLTWNGRKTRANGREKTLEEAPQADANRLAELELRKANLAIRISQKVRSRGSGLRIIEDDHDEP